MDHLVNPKDIQELLDHCISFIHPRLTEVFDLWSLKVLTRYPERYASEIFAGILRTPEALEIRPNITSPRIDLSLLPQLALFRLWLPDVKSLAAILNIQSEIAASNCITKITLFFLIPAHQCQLLTAANCQRLDSLVSTLPMRQAPTLELEISDADAYKRYASYFPI
ncbi:hypothetical protein DFH09DRAFT_1313978 [Mycena vulgaris]|nr:hypothetical protein DFH09DRAFT_1313978 [Mycena vulgaris]